MSVMSRALARLDDFLRWTQSEHWLVAAALVRIGFGSIVFLLLLICFPQRETLFFNGGIEPLSSFVSNVAPEWGPSVFALPISRSAEDVVYVGAMVVAALFTLGIWTRVLSILFAVVTWSFVHRCPGFIDGGYRLLCIMTIYLCGADLGARFSLDTRFPRRMPESLRRVSAMVHNAAMVTAIAQLCVVYVFSAFFKAQGAAWQQGTALYYVLSEPQFNISPVSAFVNSSQNLIALGSYGTMLFQSAFPWLLINERCRFFAVVVGISFHVGIALTMGLFWFSAVMIVCELLVLTDADYAVLFRAADRFFSFPSSRRERIEAR